MRKNAQPCRLTISERLYALLVWFYPKPFRDAFGTSMKQVFRDQCSDAISQRRWSGWIGLWIRVLFDFAWTCPKEHLIALPPLPSRLWEDVLRKPVWFHPTLIAVLAFGLSVFVTLNLPQFYASTVTLEVTKAKPAQSEMTSYDRYFIPTEFEKLKSKTVLYPVIDDLALGVHYGALSPTADKPPYELSTEEAYQSLRNNLRISQVKNTELIEVTVLDEDKSLATKIANEIGMSYRRWRIAQADEDLRRNVQLAVKEPSQNDNQSIEWSDAKSWLVAMAGNLPTVKIINPAEDAIRPSLPNRPLNIFLGGTTSLSVGGVMTAGLWPLKRKHARRAALVANQIV